jgi:hypothetical protein
VINIDFEGTDQQLVAFVRSRMPVLKEALRLKMQALMLMLQAHIIGTKLTGQVLHQRTGKLIDSVRLNPAEATATDLAVEGGVQAGGGPAWYARIWELTGLPAYEIVPVNKKALAFMLDGKQIIVRRVMHPAVGPKPFMKPSFEEKRDEILAGLQEAANGAMSQ